MNWLRNFMYGRYGMDKLNFVLLILGVAINLLTSLVGRFFIWIMYGWVYTIIWLIGILPLVLALYRALSRNIPARQKELYRYQRFEQWVKRLFGRGGNSSYGNNPYGNSGCQNSSTVYTSGKEVKDRKNYKYFQCPSCHQKIRVPKGRGKIRIHCPKCGHDFEKKT